jgi:hypothetical protein
MKRFRSGQVAGYVLVATVAAALCAGCGFGNRRVPVLALSVRSLEWKEEITFFTDESAC